MSNKSPLVVAMTFIAVVMVVLSAFLVPSGVAQAQEPAFDGVVLQGARVRAGAGTNHAILTTLPAGTAVRVVGCNAACDWYELEGGGWMAAFLIGESESRASTGGNVPAGAQAVQVLSITDGDTIRVMYNGSSTPVRYIGMNTPEVGDAYASDATAYNSQLVSGATVYLEKDVSETDRYGRLLRYVWLADGRMVNEEIVQAGLAQTATYPPDVKYQSRLLTAEQDARAAGRGYWNEPAPAPVVPTPAPAPSNNCDSHYPTICIPVGIGDLDCGQISARRFAVVGGDPHRFDGDHDGVGCES